MKPTPFPIALGLAVAFAAAVVLAAQTPSTPDPATAGSHERVSLKVLKVYSAKDGDAIFRAYVVAWKGEEVVVSDTLAQTNYREGDMITVLAMNQPFPKGARDYRLLHFTAFPQSNR